MATETEVGELLHGRGWRKAFSVAECVNDWTYLVSSIERGYSDNVHEYANDLYCRKWLHEAWLLLDDTTVQLWTPHVKAADARYRAATIDDDGYVLGQFHGPRVLTGELGRALRTAGARSTAPDPDPDAW